MLQTSTRYTYGHPKAVALKETGSGQVRHESRGTGEHKPDQRHPVLPKDKPTALSTPNPVLSLDETVILPRDGSA